MSELINTLVTKQDLEDGITDLREDARSLIILIREDQKSIFRWLLFFAILQTATTSAILIYFMR